jgi:hypothetical protein
MEDIINLPTQWWKNLNFTEKYDLISIWKSSTDGFPDARKEWSIDEIGRSQQLIHELHSEFKLK